MLHKKKEHPKEKTRLHKRNKHRGRYDFKQLIESCPDLAQFVKLNVYGDESIDFANPQAVKMLNKALLKYYYDIDKWDIPQNYLCPPIPGRADYIHHISDILGSCNYGKIPTGPKIKCLDVGIGANCVYPIIGVKEYGWSFVGAEIDPGAVASANKIIDSNPVLKGNVEVRMQHQPNDIFFGIIQKNERFDLTVCNPPFHASLAEAQAGTLRKLSNLNKEQIEDPVLNFGGQSTELWCKGGEERFIEDMIRQSKLFSSNCFWFSTAVAKQSHLKNIYLALEKAEAVEVRTIPMGQGNKSSRIVAWTFFTPEDKKQWINTRWNETV
ncbi:MAG: 23S rRNA (adenine(1618)-N(6))-methyltransferase RlmF [Bacteroidota bacterium]|nr:23S rRNA (adenine(1618)-N(6))-methyltransferase RlmF [Bacteroidota bacterium]